MNMHNLKTTILSSLAVGISILLLLFVIGGIWIGHEVKSNCFLAQNAYGGECVTALTQLLNDKNRSFRERNSAIWTLGQLADQRALPVLEKYYTGHIPDREPLNGTISQYELSKSLKLVRGGTNLSAFIWRSGF